MGEANAGLSAIQTLDSKVVSGVENIQSVANTVSSEVSTWEPLLANVKIISTVLDGIVEVRLSKSRAGHVHERSLDSPIRKDCLQDYHGYTQGDTLGNTFPCRFTD